MTVDVVSAKESYRRLDPLALFGDVGSCKEVELAEIYSPSKFWVIHRGEETSEALSDIMDRMVWVRNIRL